MSKYLVLHQEHGIGRWFLIFEGDGDGAQAYLNAEGAPYFSCKVAEHLRVYEVTRGCDVRPNTERAKERVFYV